MGDIRRSGRFINGVIFRGQESKDGTPGVLTLDNTFTCDTLELPWRNNQRGVSCIRPDTYRGWVWESPTMGHKVIRLEDKNGRADCLIHNGIWAGDTLEGETTHVHGCTLVGHGYGVITWKGVTQWGIYDGIKTLADLIESLQNEDGSYDDVMIRYEYAEGCAPEGV